jgi:hypothetical protein
MALDLTFGNTISGRAQEFLMADSGGFFGADVVEERA